ncbi:MAG: hypothetical protein GY772_31600 [bacterium]|nr:hypothetical protein [bacterium]
MTASGLEAEPLPEGWAPLEAGIYDVEVAVGPTFRSSGFGEFDVDDPDVRGRAVKPSRADLCEWSKVMCDCVRDGCDFRGGWAPDRSAVVVWRGSRERYYYKCNDEGAFDLAWHPALAGPWDGKRRDAVFTRVLLDFYFTLRKERRLLTADNVPDVIALEDLDAEIETYRRALRGRGINLQ